MSDPTRRQRRKELKRIDRQFEQALSRKLAVFGHGGKIWIWWRRQKTASRQVVK